MTTNNTLTESDIELFNSFKKEISEIDFNLMHKTFNDFLNTISLIRHNLNITSEELTYVWPGKKSKNKLKEIEFITRLSKNLLIIIKTQTKALLEYALLTDSIIKPMKKLGDFEHLTVDISEIVEFKDDVKTLLKNIAPVYKYLNYKVKVTYNDIDVKTSDLLSKERTIIQKNKKLNKFISRYDKKSDYVKIYIDLLRVSNKIPTDESLAIASGDNKISKSTWNRMLNKSGYIKILKDELTKLITRTKNEKKLELYRIVFNKLDEKYISSLQNDFKIKKAIKFTSKDKSKSVVEDIQDKEQYDKYINDRYNHLEDEE